MIFGTITLPRGDGGGFCCTHTQKNEDEEVTDRILSARECGRQEERATMDKFALDKLKNVMDDAKSAVKAKMGTDVEKKMEEALSNKNWGASSTLLNEISQLTYD
ncbi:hypothetical protein BBJ28_00003271 [Nothophytophthora sp. Chile5]|nr:hypothetical protein BBJ28_00003271 [Nothophytophthora sp. Chile5]